MLPTFWGLRLRISHKSTSLRVFRRSPPNSVDITSFHDFLWGYQFLNLVEHGKPDESHVFVFRLSSSSLPRHDILDFILLFPQLFDSLLPYLRHFFLLWVEVCIHNFDITRFLILLNIFYNISFLIAKVLHKQSYVFLGLIGLKILFVILFCDEPFQV